MYMLGVDIGSSFLKSSILDLNTMTIKNTRSVPTPDFITRNTDARELSLDTLAESVGLLIDETMAEYQIAGIVMSVQMHGFILLDEIGNELTDYVTWQDMRAGHADFEGMDAARFISGTAGASLLKENGITLKNNHSLCPLYCCIKDMSMCSPVSVKMLGDALIWKLTGENVPIHPTEAASSGMYSLVKNEWNYELLEKLGLKNISLPSVYDGQKPVAWYKDSVPMYAAVGDHQAAVLGTYADEGDVIINIGTGGQISYLSRDLNFGEYETRPFFNGQKLRAFTQRPSGRSLSVLSDFIAEIGREVFGCEQVTSQEIWQPINRLTQCGCYLSDTELSLNLSFFDAEPKTQGSICGISNTNLHLGNLFASAYSSMADEYCKAYRELLKNGEDAHGVICTGGVIRKSPLLYTMLGQRLKVPCTMAPFVDDTMVGLLRLAYWHVYDSFISL